MPCILLEVLWLIIFYYFINNSSLFTGVFTLLNECTFFLWPNYLFLFKLVKLSVLFDLLFKFLLNDIHLFQIRFTWLFDLATSLKAFIFLIDRLDKLSHAFRSVNVLLLDLMLRNVNFKAAASIFSQYFMGWRAKLVVFLLLRLAL